MINHVLFYLRKKKQILINKEFKTFLNIELKKIFVKMKPLVTNYRVLTWLCVCPPEESINRRRKLVYIPLISSILIGNIFFVWTSIVFFTKTVSVNLEASLFSLLQILAFSNIIYLIIVASILRRQIAGLFSGLSRIYDESENN